MARRIHKDDVSKVDSVLDPMLEIDASGVDQVAVLDADPRSLPAGQWQIDSHAKGDTRFYDAVDLQTKDHVRAIIYAGDLEDNPPSWWGLPDGTSASRVWNLGRIEPRNERAKGGTKALLQRIAADADAAGVYVITSAQPIIEARQKLVLHVLAKHGGFVAADAEYFWILVRRPRS